MMNGSFSVVCHEASWNVFYFYNKRTSDAIILFWLIRFQCPCQYFGGGEHEAEGEPVQLGHLHPHHRVHRAQQEEPNRGYVTEKAWSNSLLFITSKLSDLNSFYVCSNYSSVYNVQYIKPSSNSIIPKYLPFHFTSRESNVVLPRIVCRVGDIDGGKILWLRGEGALLEQVSFHLETGKIERTTTFIWLRILLDREGEIDR